MSMGISSPFAFPDGNDVNIYLPMAFFMTTLWFPHSFPAKGKRGIFATIRAGGCVGSAGRARAEQEGSGDTVVFAFKKQKQHKDKSVY
jgi:hypothetical protein